MAKGKGRHKKVNWLNIRTEFEFNGASLSALARKYKVSRNTLAKRRDVEGWQDKSAEIQQKVCEKTAEVLVEEKVAVNKRHIQLANDSLDLIKILLEQYKSELLSGEERPKATAMSVDSILSAIAKAQKIQRLALNIEDDDGSEEPEINIIKGLDITKI